MADSPKDSDQSMEDILQSIKRIIADEGDPAPAAPAPGSDVLELTELLAEDVAVPQPAAIPEPVAEPAIAPSISLDDIMAEPAAPAPEPEPAPAMTPSDVAAALFDEPAPAATEPEVHFPEPDPEPVMAPVAQAPVAAAPVAAPAPVVHEKPTAEPLLSDQSLAASIAALNVLSHATGVNTTTSPSPNFRSGTTVEDIALEAIRPIVKEWLDANLPTLVRQLVEKEIRRISGL